MSNPYSILPVRQTVLQDLAEQVSAKRSQAVPTLTREDASIVKGMIARGDRQSDIAAFFGVNGGRIAEINTKQKWADVTAAAPEFLPPAGPYLAGRSALRARDTLMALREIIDETLATIRMFEDVQ